MSLFFRLSNLIGATRFFFGLGFSRFLFWANLGVDVWCHKLKTTILLSPFYSWTRHDSLEKKACCDFL